MANPSTYFTMNKNGATGLQVVIAYQQTGEFEDINTLALVADDELDHFSDALTAPASISGGIAYTYACVLFETIVTSAVVKDVIQRGVVPRAR